MARRSCCRRRRPRASTGGFGLAVAFAASDRTGKHSSPPRSPPEPAAGWRENSSTQVRHIDPECDRAWKLCGSLSGHDPTRKRPQSEARNADLAPDTRKRPAVARIRSLLIRKRSQVRVLDRPSVKRPATAGRPSSFTPVRPSDPPGLRAAYGQPTIQRSGRRADITADVLRPSAIPHWPSARRHSGRYRGSRAAGGPQTPRRSGQRWVRRRRPGGGRCVQAFEGAERLRRRPRWPASRCLPLRTVLSRRKVEPSRGGDDHPANLSPHRGQRRGPTRLLLDHGDLQFLHTTWAAVMGCGDQRVDQSTRKLSVAIATARMQARKRIRRFVPLRHWRPSSRRTGPLATHRDGLRHRPSSTDNARMYLSWRYVLALVAALIGLAAYVVVPEVAHTIHAQQARDDLAAATAAVARLRVPAEFTRVATTDNDAPCPGSRCYLVDKSTLAVAPLLPAMLGSIGVSSAQDGICTAVLALGRAAAETCRIRGGVCTANTTQFPQTGSCRATKGFCTISHRANLPPWEMCQLFATIHNNGVSILLQPYIACRPSGPPCRRTNDSQVIFYGP